MHIHEFEMYFHENNSEIFDVILHHYFHNRPVWRYRSILWILMNVHGNSGMSGHVREKKTKAKHVWWHNIFSAGQIMSFSDKMRIFNFSWNLKFRKNLNFCQNWHLLAKLGPWQQKSVCPNYNIPRFFFSNQHKKFSPIVSVFLLKKYGAGHRNRVFSTLNRPQIKLWKSNFLFVILLILTFQKPLLGCIFGYISLSLPVFCGSKSFPAHQTSCSDSGGFKIDIDSVVFLKKSWNECQGKYIQIVFGTAGERGRGNQLSISWFRNCSIRLNSGSLRTLTFESLQFILISKKSLPGYFWNRNVKGESTWKWCVLIEHMILQFLKHPFHIEYL